MLQSIDFKFTALGVSINTESGDVIHIVHMVTHKMKEFVDFNSRNLVKSPCMGKYSIINMINKKVLSHITTCLQSKVWGEHYDEQGAFTSTFRQMGDGRFEDSEPFDGEIR